MEAETRNLNLSDFDIASPASDVQAAAGGGMQNMAVGGGGVDPLGIGGGETTGFRGGLGCGFQSTQYTAVRFGYAKNGRTVTYAMGEKWCNADGLGCEESGSYEVTWAKEFRYDGARQRYLERELDPDDLESGTITALSETLTHYDGNEPYSSRKLVYGTGGNPDVVTMTGHELGIARIDDPNGTPSTDYYHTDMLGTTRFLTDDAGGVVDAASYTAFGELICGTSDRFGYVGAYGYQTHDEMPYLHVGARYYDPSIGRFLQRDPIGIEGESNVYAYVGNTPTDDVDPEGLQRGRPIRIPSRGGRLPMPRPPSGYWRSPPDALSPSFPPNQDFGSIATNCLMWATGGNYVGAPRRRSRGCMSCNHYDGKNHYHASPPRKSGHTLRYPLRGAALAMLLYVVGWSVADRRKRQDFGKHAQGMQR